MPIGFASYLEPHPGISADWLILGPGWVAGARPGGGRSRGRRGPGAHRAPPAGRPAPVPRGGGRRHRRAGCARGGGRPVRARARPGPGRGAGPPGPAGRRGGHPGRARRLHLLGRGVRRRRQPGALRPDLPAGARSSASTAGTSGPSDQVLRAVAADPDVTGVDDARIGGAQSGQVSVESFTDDPVGGKRVPVVLTGGRMPAAADEIVLAPTTASDMHAGIGSVVQLTGSTVPRAMTVTGIGFVPEGPHNEYDQGAWLTPAGFDRLFRGAHYAFKFHLGTVALRPGADVEAVAHRLTAKAAAIKGGQAFPFQPGLSAGPGPGGQGHGRAAAGAERLPRRAGRRGRRARPVHRRPPPQPRAGRAARARPDPAPVPAGRRHAGEPARRHRDSLRDPAGPRPRPGPVARRRRHDAAGL